ncbi:PREDICTED: shikimate O-hydroxycinnamoyltransferase-like [Tarenaya hassleriana]|uniref:shikimate O-hydroxycinnamoyltransferase-like n=1 Tax=Tarenaya hassleriana TaxID=28532 RepID=UPI00053C9B11|nr:PREDICTED: shikimate O-hydroxycinnamoyltransferase-like [Tarenaya hassleriana]
MKVDIKETTLVCPVQDDTPGGSLWLSEIDLFYPNMHNKIVLFFKATADTNYPSRDEMTRILKQSLGKVLISFYPVAGRLGKDEKGRVQIECNAEGATFAVAEADCTLDEMLDTGGSDPSSKFKLLIDPVDYSIDTSSFPLLLSKVTYFECGGMCLGVAMHQRLADGVSIAHFVKSWADTARGQSIDDPIHDRRLISDRALPSIKFDHPEFDPNAMFGHRKPNQTPVDISTVYLKISVEQMNALKDKANANANRKNYSLYQSLSAHLWRCACEARGLSDDQKTVFVFPVNIRPRLRPPLPRELFSNAIYITLASAANSGEIVKEPLSFTAGRIRKAIKEIDDEYVRSGITYLREKQVADGVSVRSAYQNPNIGFVSWTHMPILMADFGWGLPILWGPASIRSEGLAYLLPVSSREEDGLALYMCLETQHIELFKKLFYEI